MMANRELRQNTAVTVKIGPFISSTGTLITDLTIVQGDVMLSKAGAAGAQKSNASACTYDTAGVFFCSFAAGDVDTLGELRADIDKSGSAAIGFPEIWSVITQQVWDSKYSTDRLQVDVQEIASGLMTAGVIGTGAITGGKFAAGALTAGVFAADALTAGTFATGAFTADVFAADAIAAATIASGAITGDAFAAGALTAGVFAGGAITAGTLADDAISAAKIATGAITADAFAADALTAGTIAAGAITSAKLAAGTITGGAFAAGALTAGIWAAGSLTAGTLADDILSAAKIATGAITADAFAASALTAGTFADDFLTAAKIASAAITADAFASGALTAGTFGASAFTSAVFAGSCLTLSNFDQTYRLYFATDIPRTGNFYMHVLMVNSSDHRTGETGLSTLTMTRTIDGGGSWGAGSAAISEIGNGMYLVALAESDRNGTVCSYRFYVSGENADDVFVTIKTST